MKSKWFEIKKDAIDLRKQGLSIRAIGGQLKIPKSTLSNWFKNIKLTESQKENLLKNRKNGLIKARERAILWHNQGKQKRLEDAKIQASNTLENLDLNDENIINLAMGMLYLGEGFKTTVGIGIGNSDPLILKFFITALRKIYQLPIAKIKCELHLRADQKAEIMKKYWSEALDIPISNFTTVSFDKRTLGSVTKPEYKGVCVLRCSNAAIQRKLMYLSRMFLKKAISICTVSSVG